MFVKSLARMKREKLYGALDKGRKKVPEEWDFETLIKAFYREEVEFIKAYNNFAYEHPDLIHRETQPRDDPSVADIKAVMYEIADLSNILDFIFAKMLEEIEIIMKVHKDKRMIKELKDLSHEQKTDSINFIIGLLQHDMDEQVKDE
jgi:hypothetical protein